MKVCVGSDQLSVAFTLALLGLVEDGQAFCPLGEYWLSIGGCILSVTVPELILQWSGFIVDDQSELAIMLVFLQAVLL